MDHNRLKEWRTILVVMLFLYASENITLQLACSVIALIVKLVYQFILYHPH